MCRPRVSYLANWSECREFDHDLLNIGPDIAATLLPYKLAVGTDLIAVIVPPKEFCNYKQYLPKGEDRGMVQSLLIRT